MTCGMGSKPGAALTLPNSRTDGDVLTELARVLHARQRRHLAAMTGDEHHRADHYATSPVPSNPLVQVAAPDTSTIPPTARAKTNGVS